MVSLFRLKGRALQIDNVFIMSLTFFTGLLLLVVVNFLPTLYIRFIVPFFYFEKEKMSAVINVLFASVFLFVTFGFYSAIRLGTKRYLFKRTLKKKATAEDVFNFFRFREFFASFIYSLKISAVRLILFLFCFFPCMVCITILHRFFQQNASLLVCVSLTVTAVFLFVNGGFFYSLLYSSFFLCDYYFIEGTGLSFRHIVASSQRNMRRKNTLITSLKLSFIGWFVFCIFVLPIPYVWGYYNQSLAVAAAEFMREKES